MEKKIYVVGLDSEDIKAKSEVAVNTLDGIKSVLANMEKAQVLVDFDESIADLESKITTALESVGLTVLD